MASDLSTLIKDGLCSTIQGLLAKDVIVNDIFKVEKENFDDTQVLSIYSTFEFENITSSWNFIFPAFTSSIIFNSMMGMEEEPSSQIDNDMADAIKEVVSNISGGLTTAINGAGYEDLTGAKFSLNQENIINANELENFDNIFKFSINIDQTAVDIFIQFDNVILPFINDIKNSPLAPKPIIEEPKEEQNTPEPEPEPKKEEPQPIKEEPKEEPKPVVEESKEEEPKEELSDEDKKNKKIKMIIIALGGTLALVIISAIVFYFLGWFDPPPPPPAPVEQNATKKLDKNGVEVVEYPKRKKSKFRIEMINVNRLNSRLALLIATPRAKTIDSKIPIVPVTIKEQTVQKVVSKKVMQPKQAIVKKKTSQQITAQKTQATNQTNKLNFIATYVLRYRTYKKLLQKYTIANARISLCRDKSNRTIIYIGPFSNPIQEAMILNQIKSKYTKDVKKITLDQKTVNKRCN